MSIIDLDTLPLPELEKLQKDVEKAIVNFQERRLQEARRVVAAQLQEMGFTLDEIVGGTSGQKGKKGKMPVAAKYQHPENPSLTWTGKGRRPAWFKEAIDGGTTEKDLRIG